MNIIDFTYINFKENKPPTSVTTGDDLIQILLKCYKNKSINKISLYIWNKKTSRTYKHTVYTKETTTCIQIFDSLYHLHEHSQNDAMAILQTLHQHLTMLAKKITHIYYNKTTFRDMISINNNAEELMANIISFYNNHNYMSITDIIEENEFAYILSLN